MDIQSRKIEFVQAFLKLQSEEVISQFENLLKKNQPLEIGNQNENETFSIEELNERITRSENDFDIQDFKTTAELLSKY